MSSPILSTLNRLFELFHFQSIRYETEFSRSVSCLNPVADPQDGGSCCDQVRHRMSQ